MGTTRVVGTQVLARDGTVLAPGPPRCSQPHRCLGIRDDRLHHATDLVAPDAPAFRPRLHFSAGGVMSVVRTTTATSEA